MIKYNLVGKKFGKLTVIENMPSKNQSRMWMCICDCGEKRVYKTKILISGQAVTCGCSKYTRARKHGYAGSRIYHVWFAMKKRCSDRNNKQWHNYGGRGIAYPRKWDKFGGFLEDMGANYKIGLQLDRIDNNANYSKENCRWVDAYTQANNTRRNRFITFNGRTLTLAQWERKLGFGKDVVGRRIRNRGWSIKKALNTPAKGK